MALILNSTLDRLRVTAPFSPTNHGRVSTRRVHCGALCFAPLTAEVYRTVQCARPDGPKHAAALPEVVCCLRVRTSFNATRAGIGWLPPKLVTDPRTAGAASGDAAFGGGGLHACLKVCLWYEVRRRAVTMARVGTRRGVDNSTAGCVWPRTLSTYARRLDGRAS